MDEEWWGPKTVYAIATGFLMIGLWAGRVESVIKNLLHNKADKRDIPRHPVEAETVNEGFKALTERVNRLEDRVINVILTGKPDTSKPESR